MLDFLLPKLTSFTDDEIIEAGVKFLERDRDSIASIVQSRAGQEVLARLRGQDSEPQGVFHRCSECGFAEELFIK